MDICYLFLPQSLSSAYVRFMYFSVISSLHKLPPSFYFLHLSGVQWSVGLVITTPYLLVIICQVQSYKHALEQWRSLAKACHDMAIPETWPVSGCYECNKRHLTHKAVHLDQRTAFHKEHKGKLLRLESRH